VSVNILAFYTVDRGNDKWFMKFFSSTLPAFCKVVRQQGLLHSRKKQAGPSGIYTRKIIRVRSKRNVNINIKQPYVLDFFGFFSFMTLT